MVLASSRSISNFLYTLVFLDTHFAYVWKSLYSYAEFIIKYSPALFLMEVAYMNGILLML